MTEAKSTPKNQKQEDGFQVVGIGASAGGLKAITELLQNLPNDTGMAFIIVQHLSPDHESLMPEILSRTTSIQVNTVTNGMPVMPNRVYVMPENVSLSISNGILKVHAIREELHSLRLPIDSFLSSLATDLLNRSIGVILSGAASDGSHGLMEIKQAGGITFAQDEDSAEYKSMPQNAAATGIVDFICSPKEIAEKITAISRHPYSHISEEESADPVAQDGGAFQQILKLLQKSSRISFANYKPATIQRRVVRRMVLCKTKTLKEYVALLEKTPKELQALLQDVLIHVTEFFRDPEIYNVLKKDVFPRLIKNRGDENPLRVWVVGCSTGEEVYSIAIALFEFLGERLNDFPIQIFATDVNESCVETARKGFYPQGPKFNVSEERLRRFFMKVGGGYQIIKSVRDVCVFAKHNVLSDPPYSKIDLVSCRNVLIYFDPILQKKVLPTFHYALTPEGFLLLGKSESIAAHTDLFGEVDKKTKIYSKKMTASRNNLVFARHTQSPNLVKFAEAKFAPEGKSQDIFKEADRAILLKHASVGVVVNQQMEIVQFRGDTGLFLNNAPGAPSNRILKMARQGLGGELAAALAQANQRGIAVKKTGIPIKHHGKMRDVAIEVLPLKQSSDGAHFLILFSMSEPAVEEKKNLKSKTGQKPATAAIDKSKIRYLEKELNSTKAYLKSIIEERETSHLELQAASEEAQSSNEEFQSMNEELQSTNEELETAKEELQATNEEITTVNDELQDRISQLTVLNDDLGNLLNSIHLPVIIVNRELQIRRFTVSAEKIFRLMASDIGRPLNELKLNIKLPLSEVVAEVITTATVQAQEVQDDEGRWYMVRVRPYKTTDNKIDGAIIVLTDIDSLKKSTELLEVHQEKLEESNQELEQFAYVASHDLQEPLRVIVMQLELLKRRFKDKVDEDAHEFIAHAKNGAERAEKLIRDLLHYARIGTTGEPQAKTDFNFILKRALSNLELAVLESGADITHGSMPEIIADRFLMVQLFQNLLSNAIKYQSENPLKIHIAAKEQDGKWLFSIQDNGIGIEAKYKNKIFALFQRLHTKADLQGDGIGLAVCKKIVERHGGNIWVESKPNEGATFFFTLSVTPPIRVGSKV